MAQHQNNVPVSANASDNTLNQSSTQPEIQLAELIGADVLKSVAGSVAWEDKLIPVDILSDQKTLLLFTIETCPQKKEVLREKMEFLTNKKIAFIDETHPRYKEFSSLDINLAIRCCYPDFEKDYDVVIGESE